MEHDARKCHKRTGLVHSNRDVKENKCPWFLINEMERRRVRYRNQDWAKREEAAFRTNKNRRVRALKAAGNAAMAVHMDRNLFKALVDKVYD